MNLKIKRVASDGNCLLRSVAAQMEGLDHRLLRQLLVEEYRNHPEDYQFLYDGDEAYKLHILLVGQDGAWCDEPEIAVLANSLKVEIHVYRDNLDEIYTKYRPRDTSMGIVRIIFVQGCHYNAVVEKKSYREDPDIKIKNVIAEAKAELVPPVFTPRRAYCSVPSCASFADKSCKKCRQLFCTGCSMVHSCPVPRNSTCLGCRGLPVSSCGNCRGIFCRQCLMVHKC